MKNKSITFLLIALALVIALIFVADFISTRPDRQEANPYAYDMEVSTVVDDSLILYRETRNLKLPMENPVAITWSAGLLTVAGDHRILRLDSSGKLLGDITLDFAPVCFSEANGILYVSSGNEVFLLDPAGRKTGSFQGLDSLSHISCIVATEGNIFAADAGRRRVHRFSADGTKELEFTSQTGEGSAHGFIVPGPCFDLAISPFGDLWVVNPGKHALEEYTYDGSLRGFWQGPPSGIAGFGGCCNPARITFLPDGNMITCEKGIFRVKEYKPSGELVGVVAAPAKFREDQKIPDVCCDDKGRIYLLDPQKKMIRIFEKKG